MPTIPALRRSVATRLSLAGCLGLFLVLGAITAVMTVVSTQQARAQIAQTLLSRAEGMADALDAIDLTSRTMVERTFPVFTTLVGPALRLEQDRLFSGETLLNDNVEIVDRFAEQTSGVATIFARTAEGFRRVSTSVRRPDGSRALGTMLDPAGPAYAAVSQGQAYAGRATLFGKTYMTRYAPAKDAQGQVVAVLFTGFEIGSFDAAVEELVKATRFYDTGGIFLLDVKGGADDAVFAMHPRLKGKSVKEALPGALPFVRVLASADRDMVASPGLLSAGSDRWSVVSKGAKSGTWVVAEVSDAEAMRSHWRSLGPFLALLAVASLALAGGLLWMARRWVAAPLRELSEAARAVAEGDLSRSHDSIRPDEVGQVVRDVEAMRRSFVDLLSNLRLSADAISTASQEIASGNTDLSRRTEHAASSLQETASSMEQLTGVVRSTADAARDAAALAGQASSSANEGGEMMTSVVNTMAQIQDSAARIADISGVIDGIAFQTNILALNAAVEAARAGEQGRGFAVVAGEVRALAQRSAAAAREIKSLIAGSVDKTEVGVELVQRAGERMTQIVASVRKVNDIIAGISASAAEQSDGILQVNAAVTHLDQMTQQNAALVEESAAAAASLSGQADTLSQFMQRFQLEADR